MEPITLKHFFGGLVQPKTAVKTLAFLPWLGLWVFLGWSVYVAMIKPHFNPIRTQEIQHAEQVNYYQEADKTFFFGVKILGLRIGISK